MSKQEFDAEIKEGRGGGAYLIIPFSVKEVYGTGAQVKVKAIFDGHPYRGSLAPMGGGQHILGIRKDIRKAIGKNIGDTVHVTVQQDTEPRTVSVPNDFGKALQRNPQVKEAFDRLSYTHKKEYVQWIEEAKKQETRERRIQKAVEKIKDSV